jgi:hypothetical protein
MDGSERQSFAGYKKSYAGNVALSHVWSFSIHKI